MATTRNVTYKVYNGTDWDVIYFKTTAGNVSENNGTLNFLRPSTHKVNGKSFWSGTDHQGIVLYGSDINLDDSASAKTVRAAIKTLESDISNLNDFMAGFQGDTENITSNLLAALESRLTAETEAEALEVSFAKQAKRANVATTADGVLGADGSEDMGDNSTPVYIEGGKIHACAFEVLSNVPANAKFTDTTYSNATTSSDGLMSSTDKLRLDSMRSIFQGSETPSGMATGDIWLSY